MINRSKVVSLSFDPKKLQHREAALCAAGFEVKSVHSPGQARFEIEMGSCGIFVTGREISDIINRDLIDLFRRYCGANAFVVFVASDDVLPTASSEPWGDVLIPASRDPEGIVEALRKHSNLRV